MIRIRPGRSWRLNPGYLYELRGLDPPQARGFTGGGILDVLGIEVDGVDIAAKVGEAQVLLAVDELTQALLTLGEGSPAAQATVGPGPVEMVLEARGQDVLLTLISLAPPATVLAGGLVIDLVTLRAAALSASRGLLLDLLAISPALTDSPLSQRLSQAGALLSKRARRVAKSWPTAAPEASPAARPAALDAEPLLVRGNTEGGTRCELQLSREGALRIAARAEVPLAPLAALLGPGTLTLRVSGAPALSCEAPLFLALRNLLKDAAALVQAWEQGERTFELHFGSLELRCDLTRDEVRAPGWKRGLVCTPTQLALALAGAARAFAGKALKLGQHSAKAAATKPAGKRLRRKPSAADELLIDLRTAASELLAHCRDLATGDLRRAPVAVSAPAAQQPRAQQAPLSRGKVRRLVYREAWRHTLAAPLRPLYLLRDCGVLVLQGAHSVSGRELGSGRELWQKPCAQGFIARAENRGDLYLAEPGIGLLRLDPGTGETHFRRRMRVAAPGSQPLQLWPVPGGVLCALPGEGLAQVTAAGTLGFRLRLPGGAPEQAILLEGVLLLGLATGSATGSPTGSVFGLDPADGRILWKRKLGAYLLALLDAGAFAVALCADASGSLTVAALDPASGDPRWERALPEGSGQAALLALGDRVLAQQGPALHALSLRDGALRFSFALPWPGGTSLAAADEQEVPAHLIATGPGGAALRLDERGAPLWQIAAEGAAPFAPSLGQSVILLPRGAGTTVFDVREGLAVAQLPPASQQLIGSDLSVALSDEEGALSLHRLATHLSVL